MRGGDRKDPTFVIQSNTKWSITAYRLRRFEYLYAVLLHCERSVDAVQFEVEATRVTHGLAGSVSAPQGCRVGGAVAAGQPHAAPGRLRQSENHPQPFRG